MCVICYKTQHPTSENAAVVNSGLGDPGTYSSDYINGLIWGGGWSSGPVYYTIDQGSYGGDGWVAHQVTAIQNAVAAYNNVCGINLTYVAPGNANVDIIFATYIVEGAYGVHEVPDGTETIAGGPEICFGLYNWELFSGDTDSFDVGGFDYITLIHELGHGLGLAHPHDNGGSSTIFSGVTSSFGDYGDNNQNQGIFTTMSYNDGWQTQYPSHTDIGYGHQGTPMAFDIAALQILYGANNSYNTGSNTYNLPTVNGQNQNTYWSCIWDAGGTDTISNAGSSISCTINLNAAPLTGANAGGYVSWNSNIVGGFTIANGVVIENADGGSSTDTITGNSANNILNGNGGNDTIYGGGGNDTINGGTGNDAMYGGGGDDTFKVDSSSDSVTENSSEGTDTVESSVTFTLGNNIENLTLTGSSSYNLTGNSSNNTLTGNSGNNLIDGAGGNDSYYGGDGNDTYMVSSGNKIIYENENEGIDKIKTYVSFDMSSMENIERIQAVSGGNITLTANSLNNVIQGNRGNNVIYAGDGDDFLDGADGVDTLYGGRGNDTYIIRANDANDVIVEYAGEGNTDVVVTFIDYDISSMENIEKVKAAGSGNITLIGNSLNNVMPGNPGNNTLYGMEGNDFLDGGLGVDTLIGGEGSDTYNVDTITDIIIENANEGNADTIQTSVSFNMNSIDNVERLYGIGHDAINLTGNSLNNTILGNSNNNEINGGEGHDRIDGKFGNDTLTGGNGVEWFMFTTTLDEVNNVDNILDFTSGIDQIRLDNYIFSSFVSTGYISNNHFFQGISAASAEHFIIYDNTTGALYYDQDGDGGNLMVQFANLEANTALEYSDFFII